MGEFDWSIPLSETGGGEFRRQIDEFRRASEQQLLYWKQQFTRAAAANTAAIDHPLTPRFLSGYQEQDLALQQQARDAGIPVSPTGDIEPLDIEFPDGSFSFPHSRTLFFRDRSGYDWDASGLVSTPLDPL